MKHIMCQAHIMKLNMNLLGIECRHDVGTTLESAPRRASAKRFVHIVHSDPETATQLRMQLQIKGRTPTVLHCRGDMHLGKYTNLTS